MRGLRHLTISALLPLLIAACAHVAPTVQAPCRPRSDESWSLYDSTRAEVLAGRYDLVLVSDWEELKGKHARGRLVLQPTDTLRRFYVPRLTGGWHRSGNRPLWGWAEIDVDAVNAGSSGNPRSHDPDAPGVLLDSDGSLELGVWRGNDGFSTTLTIERVSSHAFSGRWTTSLGILYMVRDGRRLPNPNGTFCAVRR